MFLKPSVLKSPTRPWRPSPFPSSLCLSDFFPFGSPTLLLLHPQKVWLPEICLSCCCFWACLPGFLDLEQPFHKYQIILYGLFPLLQDISVKNDAINEVCLDFSCKGHLSASTQQVPLSSFPALFLTK